MEGQVLKCCLFAAIGPRQPIVKTVEEKIVSEGQLLKKVANAGFQDNIMRGLPAGGICLYFLLYNVCLHYVFSYLCVYVSCVLLPFEGIWTWASASSSLLVVSNISKEHLSALAAKTWAKTKPSESYQILHIHGSLWICLILVYGPANTAKTGAFHASIYSFIELILLPLPSILTMLYILTITNPP